MSKWLDRLRDHEKERYALPNGTDKTDKTQPDGVLSVLSVPSGRESSDFVAIQDEVAAPPDERAPIGARHNQTTPHPDDWDADEWWAFFDERAGIAEFDGRMSRAEAEDAAYQSCLAQWQYRNPVRSQPAQCCQCGGLEPAGGVLLAIGLAPDQVWLHDGCWSAWRSERVLQAKAFLTTIGINRSTQS